MAIHAHSTTAPARPLSPVRDARGRFVKLASVPKSGETPELPPEPLLSADSTARQACDASALAWESVPESTALHAARTLHLRRQFEAAAEHGIAVLSVLGLPRLVGPDFVRHDIVTVGDALDFAIAMLDAIDGDTDIEDGHDAEAVNEDGDDLNPGEMEEGDREPWLAAAEGAQHYRGGDLDLEQDGEIERPWWGTNAAGFNDDGGRYA